MSMKWVDKEDDALRAGIEANLTVTEIIDDIAVHGVTRTVAAICNRARVLGLPSPLESVAMGFADMDRAFRRALEKAHPDRGQPFRDKGFEIAMGICPNSVPARPIGEPRRSGSGCALA